MKELDVRRWFRGFCQRTPLLGAAALLGSLAIGCGEGFDPASEVKTLRVLGVQKDRPYPIPGEDIALTMLWTDPEGNGRPIQRTWLPLCINPPGDLYYGCFTQPEFLGEVASGFASSSFARGDVFQASVPNDIVSRRPPAPSGQPRYGLIFSFFTICAGEVAPDLAPAEGALPIQCLDAEGNRLGADDFIVGYSSLYVFPHKDGQDFIRNQNPEVLGFEVAGTRTRDEVTCVGAACVSEPPFALPDIDCSDPRNDGICFDACSDDGDSSCPEIAIKPVLPANVAEDDEVSAEYYGRPVKEQMWINYYVDRGSTKSEVRLLNDAVTGPNEDFGTDFFAPKDPGSVNVWAVVHDNRGGASWVRTRIGIR